MNKEPNIYSFADECYVYYGDYKKDIEEKDKEIERLKAREQECIDKYLAESKYRSEIEGKYVVDEYIINELERFLNDYVKIFKDNDVFRDRLLFTYAILDKLKELKEGKE